MYLTQWSEEQVRQITDRIGLRFSPILGDYMTEGFAACPLCQHHVVARCDGPASGGRIIVLTIRCPACGTTTECDYLEVSIGRAVPCYRRQACV
ncbi:MAG: hypothetical protein JXQ29_10850 [Planctomycetes bacterium]|nr:hypothetical protein [Planctomycetota bacterium]